LPFVWLKLQTFSLDDCGLGNKSSNELIPT